MATRSYSSCERLLQLIKAAVIGRTLGKPKTTACRQIEKAQEKLSI